jgi:hypothetical protein
MGCSAFAPIRPSEARKFFAAPGTVLPISSATVPAALVAAFEKVSKSTFPSEAILNTSPAVTPIWSARAW